MLPMSVWLDIGLQKTSPATWDMDEDFNWSTQISVRGTNASKEVPKSIDVVKDLNSRKVSQKRRVEQHLKWGSQMLRRG